MKSFWRWLGFGKNKEANKHFVIHQNRPNTNKWCCKMEKFRRMHGKMDSASRQ